MNARARIALVVAAVAALGIGVPARAAPSGCIWGGTPAAPTGQFSFSPGLRFQPSTQPLAFKAWGPAEGAGCNKTVVFEGVALPGSTCGEVFFQGAVKGVPGIRTFYGGGPSAMVHEFLYDKDGNIAGLNDPMGVNPQLAEFIANDATDDGQLACNTAQGFDRGYFSSVITVFSPKK